MRTRLARLGSLLGAIGLVVSGCEGNPPPSAAPAPSRPAPPPTPPAGVTVDSSRLVLYPALPKEAASDANPITDAKVALGHALFFEAKASSSGHESCESCHALETSGVDWKPLSDGQDGKPLSRNTPTVFNAALSTSYGWTGQVDTLEHFVKAHLGDPKILGTTDGGLAKLNKGRGFKALVTAAFPADAKGLTVDDASLALGAYLRRLLTPSPWDKFVGGDQSALTDDQKKGFNLFADTGCMTCHSGVNIGGMLIQKLGLISPWPTLTTGDTGRAEITKNDDDKMMFRSAPLRNVTKTIPWSVDGSQKDLGEMVKLMAKHQLGKDLSDADAKSIVTFLGALEGTPPPDLIKKPGSP